jgi:hypothetical protein
MDYKVNYDEHLKGKLFELTEKKQLIENEIKRINEYFEYKKNKQSYEKNLSSIQPMGRL